MNRQIPHLAWVELGVQDLGSSQRFYCDVLGMDTKDESETHVRVGFDGADADVVLRESVTPYQGGPRDRYWKIGITLPNVDLGAKWLRSCGYEVSEPRQFLDIGYMCHTADPDGYAIELLQHSFENNRPENSGDENLPLGGGGRVGQITIRVDCADKAVGYFRDELGMLLLSIQLVTGYGFTLYFLAYTNENPPGSLHDPKIREWLWKRPYTTLELQCFEEGEAIANGIGYSGFAITGLAETDIEPLVVK